MGSRSTLLKLAAKHCLRALDFADLNTPYDRDMFATGIAGHAVLQVVAQSPDGDPVRIGDAVVHELTTKGRSFDGIHESPLPIDQCVAGRDLAFAWLAEHPIPAGAQAEIGIAVDPTWKLTEYGPAARYRAILDLKWVEQFEDEETSATIAVARDYKSAWVATEEDLDGVQMHGQAVLLALMHPKADAVRIEIANLRTRKIYDRTIWLDDDGLELLERWRKDIDLAIAATEVRDEAGRRPASPGAGCTSCPYLTRCGPAHAVLRGTLLEDGPEKVALRYAVAKAMTEELGERLRTNAAEQPIRIDGGSVGYEPKATREPASDAATRLAHAWFHVAPEEAFTWDAVNGELLGLLRALDPGVGPLTSAASALHPFNRGDPDWKARRGALIGELIVPTIGPSFGVHRA